jgi:hypothetical protein
MREMKKGMKGTKVPGKICLGIVRGRVGWMETGLTTNVAYFRVVGITNLSALKHEHGCQKEITQW